MKSVIRTLLSDVCRVATYVTWDRDRRRINPCPNTHPKILYFLYRIPILSTIDHLKLYVLMVEVNGMLPLMSVMSPPPSLCNLSVRTVVKLCTLGVLALE